MSAPASEGATEGRQDDDDVLGFPGDGFVDNTDANPGVLGEQDEEVMTHEWTRQVLFLPRAVARSARKVMCLRPMRS